MPQQSTLPTQDQEVTDLEPKTVPETEPKTEPTETESLQTQISELKDALRKVNAESAQRRLKIKELESKVTGTEETSGELETLRKDLASAKTALTKYAARDAFTQVATRAEIVWASDTAREDAYTLSEKLIMDQALGDDGRFDPVKMKGILTDILEARPYLHTAKQAPKPKPGATDSDKRSSGPAELSQQDIVNSKRASLGRPL